MRYPKLWSSGPSIPPNVSANVDCLFPVFCPQPLTQMRSWVFPRTITIRLRLSGTVPCQHSGLHVRVAPLHVVCSRCEPITRYFASQSTHSHLLSFLSLHLDTVLHNVSDFRCRQPSSLTSYNHHCPFPVLPSVHHRNRAIQAFCVPDEPSHYDSARRLAPAANVPSLGGDVAEAVKWRMPPAKPHLPLSTNTPSVIVPILTKQAAH